MTRRPTLRSFAGTIHLNRECSMRKSISSRLLAGLATLLMAAGLLVGTPAPRQATAAGCGENEGNLCRKNEACIWIIFFKQCTEKYDYYPK
ncbi:MAG: hypothetical protein ACE5HP_12350 [Gemmatimonadota bacterium]